jgi:hypothetical protein
MLLVGAKSLVISQGQALEGQIPLSPLSDAKRIPDGGPTETMHVLSGGQDSV